MAKNITESGHIAMSNLSESGIVLRSTAPVQVFDFTPEQAAIAADWSPGQVSHWVFLAIHPEPGGRPRIHLRDPAMLPHQRVQPSIEYLDGFVSGYILHPNYFPRYADRLSGDPFSCLVQVGDFADAVLPSAGFCAQDDRVTLIPDLTFWHTRSYCEVREEIRKLAVPWRNRIPLAFWRGSTTGPPPINYATIRSLPRFRLCALSLARRHILDARLSAVVQSNTDEDGDRLRELARSLGMLAPPIPQAEFARFRYLVDIDGNTNSWGLLAKLAMGSCILKVQSTYRQWYYRDLRPWEHYIPVRADLSDLEEKVLWCRENDDDARQIAEAGKRLADRLVFETEMERAASILLETALPQAARAGRPASRAPSYFCPPQIKSPPTGAAIIGPGLSSTTIRPQLNSVLLSFVDQSAAPGSIVAVGCETFWAEGDDSCENAASGEAVLLRLSACGDGSLAITDRVPVPPPGGRSQSGYTLGHLARMSRELSADAPGDPLLLIPSRILEKMMVPPDGDFGFRAVVTLPPRDFNRSGWKLQRALFDHGLVGIGAVQIDDGEAHCFLTSDAVSSPRNLGAGSRGLIAMTRLGRQGQFGNQLFQYAFMKLYALRHGVTATLPDWRGRGLFELDDPKIARIALPGLSFPGHVNVESELWKDHEPPVGIDISGYFQETPACWAKHRQLLRRLFRMPAPIESAIDAWRAEVTLGGERTLVAIHVRRGDFRNIPTDNKWLRMVPEEWYLAWLRTIWPELRNPVLFVATDEPDVIRPVFSEFETVWAAFGGAAQLLPDFLCDFEILRRADVLAMCNSSFSRMAAILACSTQKCFLPTFREKRFLPYEPWLDPDFWARFEAG
jgi:hypothetical protein